MVANTLSGNLDVNSQIGIILPTYCEAQNIENLICEIEELHLDSSILVVDDSSPDNTSKIVEDMQRKNSKILLLVRPKKKGIGSALTDGFKLFLSMETPPRLIITMDADYSHNPKDIPFLLSNTGKETDLIVGSRYCRGGRIVGWPYKRRIVSRTANFLARSLFALKLQDCTSGFRCYSSSLISSIVQDLHCSTYEIQIETLKQARLKGFGVKEIPVLFVNRKLGASKLTLTGIRCFVQYVFESLLY